MGTKTAWNSDSLEPKWAVMWGLLHLVCAPLQSAKLMCSRGMQAQKKPLLVQRRRGRRLRGECGQQAELPRGLRTLDAEVVVQDCKANGIPTV